MSQVIFCRTVYPYESYFDLWKIIELSGYPLIYCNEIDPESDNFYIYTVANGENRNGWPNAKARIVFFQLEYQMGKENLAPGVSEMWTADFAHAKRIGARYVPLGSHPLLKCAGEVNEPKQFDVAMLAAPSGRRYDAGGEFERAAVSVAPNGWGEERHKILSLSRAMVDIRQWHEHPFVAAQRWCIAAAYKLPMFTEPVDRRSIFQPGMHYFESEIDGIGEFVKGWMHENNTKILENLGERLHYLLCDQWSFRNIIEANV